MKAVRFTTHAMQRAEERFPGVDIVAEAKSAIPFGGQAKGDYSLLCPCGAVLVVAANGVVKSVLTKELAVANMSVVHASIQCEKFIEPVPAKPLTYHERRQAEKTQRAEKEKSRSQANKSFADRLAQEKAAERKRQWHPALLEIAKRHAAADVMHDRAGWESRKQREIELKQKLGYPNKAIDMYQSLYLRERRAIEGAHLSSVSPHRPPASDGLSPGLSARSAG